MSSQSTRLFVYFKTEHESCLALCLDFKRYYECVDTISMSG